MESGPPRLNGDAVNAADSWAAWGVHARRLPNGRMACCRHRTLPDGTELLADLDPPDTNPADFGYERWKVVPLPDSARSDPAELTRARPDWFLPPYWELR
jgi:hypothetical protein